MDGAGRSSSNDLQGVAVHVADLMAYTTQVQPKGACIQGVCSYGICTPDACAKMAAVNNGQPCKKHGFDARAVCVHPGCTAKAKALWLCGKHGGDARSVCVHPGCTTIAHLHGLCGKHGGDARGVCVYPGCTTKATARGLCVKHGGVESAKVVAGCVVHPGGSTNSQSRGLCGKHGGGTPKAMCAQPIPPANELHILETHLPLHLTQTHLDALAACESAFMPSPHGATSSSAERHYIKSEFTVKAEFTDTQPDTVIPFRTPDAWSEVVLAMSAKEIKKMSKTVELTPKQLGELKLSARKYKQKMAQRKFWAKMKNERQQKQKQKIIADVQAQFNANPLVVRSNILSLL
jgi:hypothetical protein